MEHETATGGFSGEIMFRISLLVASADLLNGEDNGNY